MPLVQSSTESSPHVEGSGGEGTHTEGSGTEANHQQDCVDSRQRTYKAEVPGSKPGAPTASSLWRSETTNPHWGLRVRGMHSIGTLGSGGIHGHPMLAEHPVQPASDHFRAVVRTASTSKAKSPPFTNGSNPLTTSRCNAAR